MPIDPTIPLYTKPPAGLDVLGSLGRVAQLQALQDEVANRAQDRKQKLADIARADKVREALANAPRLPDGSVDLRAASGAVMGLDPKTGIELGNQARQYEATDAAARVENLKAQGERFAQAGQWARAIKADPTLFDVGKQKISDLIGPEIAQHLGNQYDPAVIDGAINWGQTAEQAVQEELRKQQLAEQAARDAAAKADKDEDNKRQAARDAATASYQQGQLENERARIRLEGARVAQEGKKKDPNAEDEGIPLGVKQYIAGMARRGYTRAQAEDEFARPNQNGETQFQIHKKLDAVKVKKTFDEFWPIPKDNATAALASALNGGGDDEDAPPVAATRVSPTVVPQPKPAAAAPPASAPADVRSQLASVVDQYKKEADPRRKAALFERMKTLRSQIGN